MGTAHNKNKVFGKQTRKSFVSGRIAEISARYRRQNDRTGAPRLFCFHKNTKHHIFRQIIRRIFSNPQPGQHKGIHEGWRPPKAAATLCGAARSAASFMDGCVVAVQVEDFGLPKSAVGTVGQTS